MDTLITVLTNHQILISLAFIADNASLAVITGPAFFLKMGFQIR
jgi:hypothetical protein